MERDPRELGGPAAGAARGELLREHLELLRGFVRTRLGPSLRARESSLDLAQSICREALADLDGFEDRGADSFRHWLLQRAENKLRDRGRYWRREKRSADFEAQGLDADGLAELGCLATPSRDAVAREELERVERAFARLAPDQRQVIVLARIGGLPHAEVARRMGRTPLATRSLLARAMARLSMLLEERA